MSQQRGKDKNTEAQRTRSFNPRALSVISVPPCFKITPVAGTSLAGLESRKRERKVARTQSRKDFELPECPLRHCALASSRCKHAGRS